MCRFHDWAPIRMLVKKLCNVSAEHGDLLFFVFGRPFDDIFDLGRELPFYLGQRRPSRVRGLVLAPTLLIHQVAARFQVALAGGTAKTSGSGPADHRRQVPDSGANQPPPFGAAC